MKNDDDGDDDDDDDDNNNNNNNNMIRPGSRTLRPGNTGLMSSRE